MISIDKNLQLGTPEAAVRSCVNLLSQLFKLDEERLAYYLDLYYQVREAYEAAEAEARLGKELLQRRLEPADAAAEPDESAPAPAETPAVQAGDATQYPAADTSGQEKTVEDSEPLPPPEAFSGFEPVEIRSGGHRGAAEAAVEKRRIRERLTQARNAGLTLRQIVKAGNGNITEDQIREILDCHKVPIAVYRILDAALLVIEKSAAP